MLSLLSSVYDPLGFIAPVTLPGKVLLQELCRRNFGWDDNLPGDIQQHWTKWLEELVKLAEFKIERCIKPKDFGPLVHARVHHFSDASECGYGVVSYARMENCQHNVHVAFLLGKARVTHQNIKTHIKTGHYPTFGAHSGGSCCSSGQDVESRAAATVGRFSLLDRQHLRPEIYKK